MREKGNKENIQLATGRTLFVGGSVLLSNVQRPGLTADLTDLTAGTYAAVASCTDAGYRLMPAGSSRPALPSTTGKEIVEVKLTHFLVCAQ